MANLDELDPTLDPVVRAAMINQPTDTEEEKSTKSLDNPAEEPAEEKEVPEEKSEQEPPEEKPEPKEPPEKDEGPETKDAEKPPEAEKPKEEEKAPEEEPRKTRREKRAERKAFLDSVRREQEQKADPREQRYKTDPDYKPMEFENKDYDLKELEEDRSKYGQNEFAKGAQTAAETEKWYAEQDKFWQATEYESKLLGKDPEFAFMDDTHPETFDEDRTADINEAFLAFVGFDPEKKTVYRTDISFEKFARYEVERIKRWAEELSDESEQNLVEQKSQSAVRPSGTPKKGLGVLKPGDISKMTDEEYEKNRDEINRQILSAL